jgi:hypothetical protein
MHKGWIFAPALLALTATGCDKKVEAPATTTAGALAKGIYAFTDCRPPANQIVGRINVIVPDKLNGASIGRMVYQGRPGDEDEADTGEEKGGAFTPNAPAAAEPFDVFVNQPGVPQKGYLLVRVIIRNADVWEFYDKGKFHGVGANDPADDVLCGVKQVTQIRSVAPKQARLIAKFYVNLDKLKAKPADYAAPFTIGLTAKNTGASGTVLTPIFIDPKIRNNGGR